MSELTPAITVRDLRKVYEGKPAVDGLTLTVPRGCFFGFLGPNGAGKSTTIRMLTGLITPNSGSVELLGLPMPEQEMEIKKRIGLVPDESLLVDRLTGGTAVVGPADQPPFSPYYEPDVQIYTPDPPKAKALLRDAGYTFGPDGRARKNGRPLSLQVSYNVENATRRAIAVQIQAELEGVGIDAPLKAYPANLMFATFGQGGILTNAKYDLNVSGWTAGFDPD
ncbi:MAG: ABC transporter substrate-binding protein, partial [Acidobacteriota bacterium]|nr:ABC transporter substrate-binding protein [Acidobacteriota bacterium]